MPQSPNRLRYDPKCVYWDVKPCSILSNLCKRGPVTLTSPKYWRSTVNPLKSICAQVDIQLYAYAVYKLCPLPSIPLQKWSCPLPFARSTVGSRTFTASGAAVWNDLLAHVTAAPSLAVFRQRLKTFLFSRSYPDIVS